MSARERLSTLSSQIADRLRAAPFEVLGRIMPASNVALLVQFEGGEHAICKPVAGERPLWDFPDGTLAAREVAAYEVSVALGVDAIAPTVVRQTEVGLASLQHWIGDPQQPLDSVVDVVSLDEVPEGWLVGFAAQDEQGQPLAVVHQGAGDLRAVALLDVLLNNADRKGTHLARDGSGHLWGFDHGLTMHTEDKLRTVLWGWAGEPLSVEERDRLSGLLTDFQSLEASLGPLLTAVELDALAQRIAVLLENGVFPHPPTTWPAIPWPPV